MAATSCRNVDIEQSQSEPRRLSRYPSGVPATLEYPSIPAWGLLKRAADNFPDRTACCYYKQKWTYGTLWEDSSRAAAVLKDFGVRPGDEANLVVLDASPLDDIRNTQRIALVIHHGKMVDREGLLATGSQ